MTCANGSVAFSRLFKARSSIFAESQISERGQTPAFSAFPRPGSAVGTFSSQVIYSHHCADHLSSINDGFTRQGTYFGTLSVLFSSFLALIFSTHLRTTPLSFSLASLVVAS